MISKQPAVFWNSSLYNGPLSPKSQAASTGALGGMSAGRSPVLRLEGKASVRAGLAEGVKRVKGSSAIDIVQDRAPSGGRDVGDQVGWREQARKERAVA